MAAAVVACTGCWAAADLKAGLAGQWSFASSDGATVADQSGNGLAGRIEGGKTQGAPRALACDGFSTEVVIDERGAWVMVGRPTVTHPSRSM